MVLARGAAHRRGRQQQALAVVGQLHLADGVLAGAQAFLRIGQRHGHADRPGAGLGRRGDARQLAGQRGVHAFHPHLHRHAGRQARHLVRAHAAGQFQPGQVDDGQHLLLGRHLLARQHMALGHDAGNRRQQRGITLADAGGVQRGLGRGQRGACGVDLGA